MRWDAELVGLMASLLAYPDSTPCPRCGSKPMLELLEKVGAVVQITAAPDNQKRLCLELLQLLHRLVRQHGMFSYSILVNEMREHPVLKVLLPHLPELVMLEPAPPVALYYAQRWRNRYKERNDDGRGE